MCFGLNARVLKVFPEGRAFSLGERTRPLFAWGAKAGYARKQMESILRAFKNGKKSKAVPVKAGAKPDGF